MARKLDAEWDAAIKAAQHAIDQLISDHAAWPVRDITMHVDDHGDLRWDVRWKNGSTWNETRWAAAIISPNPPADVVPLPASPMTFASGQVTDVQVTAEVGPPALSPEDYWTLRELVTTTESPYDGVDLAYKNAMLELVTLTFPELGEGSEIGDAWQAPPGPLVIPVLPRRLSFARAMTQAVAPVLTVIILVALIAFIVQVA